MDYLQDSIDNGSHLGCTLHMRIIQPRFLTNPPDRCRKYNNHNEECGCCSEDGCRIGYAAGAAATVLSAGLGLLQWRMQGHAVENTKRL